MKEEIVRVMDELGRVVIPAEYRSALGWAPSCKLSMSRQDGQLILRAYEDTFLLCGGTENLRFLHGKAVCHRCVDELNNRG